MILTIDCGNTNITFGMMDGQQVCAQWRLHTDSSLTHDEIGGWLKMWLGDKKPEKAILASVVSGLTPIIVKAVTHYIDIPCMVVGKDVHVPVNILAKTDEVGQDRLVNAYAALKEYQPPLIIVDFGTATTLDVVNDGGEYWGGIIAPGVNLSADALYQHTARLPKVSIEKPPHVVGMNTKHAMQSGLYWGYVAMIEGSIKRINATLDKKATIIATGGLAKTFAHDIHFDATDDHLTLKGLSYFA